MCNFEEIFFCQGEFFYWFGQFLGVQYSLDDFGNVFIVIIDIGLVIEFWLVVLGVFRGVFSNFFRVQFGIFVFGIYYCIFLSFLLQYLFFVFVGDLILCYKGWVEDFQCGYVKYDKVDGFYFVGMLGCFENVCVGVYYGGGFLLEVFWCCIDLV